MLYTSRPIQRETLTDKVTQTAALAAFIGGFAFSKLQLESNDTISLVLYVMTVFSVHACTCSALTSAILYGVIQSLREEDVVAWAATKTNKLLLMLPMAKFGMGCAVYLLTVVLGSWRDLHAHDGPRVLSLAIGVMSMSTVIMTVMATTLLPSTRVIASVVAEPSANRLKAARVV